MQHNSTRLLNETCLTKTIVSMWYSQSVFYNFSNPPTTKLSANKIKDFIQLIWNTTIFTGIGVSLSKDLKKCFVVTLYWPRGNILGKYKENCNMFETNFNNVSQHSLNVYHNVALRIDYNNRIILLFLLIF